MDETQWQLSITDRLLVRDNRCWPECHPNRRHRQE